MNVADQSESSLPDLLVARARTTSDAGLAIAVAGGLFAAIAVGALRPAHGMALVSACACVTTFGAWGIADRELSEHVHNLRTAKVTLLRLARGMTAAVGVISAIMLLFDLLSVTLGNWIS